MISIKSPREIDLMRAVGRLAAETLAMLGKCVRAGVSTQEIDRVCHEYTIDHGAIPAPLNYRGFPKSVCTSLNEVICHGIPSEDEVLADGDIANIDVTSILKGFHGDTSRTFMVGNVKPEVRKLVRVTHECMMAGIAEVRPGARIGSIGAAIQEIARSHGYSVVRDYCGHGIGQGFHEDPQVPHYGKRDTGIKMKAGMTFTIEPMINMGTHHCVLLEDGWTVVTRDGKMSAQFEHTILVTGDGAEILTPWPDGEGEMA